ncbi:MAG TPA: sugar transferase [Terriglobia bacterium]|nr:sugar transferase [Terriglobia bacterium]
MGRAELKTNQNKGGSHREFRFDGPYSNGVTSGRTEAGQQIANRFFLFFDMCLIWASGGIAYQLTSFTAPTIREVPFKLFITEFAGFLLLISTLAVLFGVLRGKYSLPWRSDIRKLMSLEAQSIASAAIIAGSCMSLWGIEAVSKQLFITTMVLSWGLLVTWRRVVAGQSIAGLTEERNILIAGYGKNARYLLSFLDQNPNLGFIVKGFLDRRSSPRQSNSGMNEAEECLVGDMNDLASIAQTRFIDEIFISLPSDRALVADIAQYAFAAGINVRVVPDLCDELVVNREVEFIGGFPSITVHRYPDAILQLLAKRAMDMVASAVSLAVLMPLFAVISALIKLDSKGGVIFRSVRVGKKGKTFICYKFRTMVQNAELLKESLIHLNERSGIIFKIAADPRITRLGRVLRKFSLDELPQLWNVLKGDMSLVGPRPCVPSEYKKYSLEHLHRLEVAPGITGLWQVEARQNPSFEKYIGLDKSYVEKWNLWLDFKIMFKTVGVVVAGTGQ